MRRTLITRWGLLPILGLLGLALPGCLITSDKHIDESGTQVTSTTLDQIEPGVTTEGWIIATLGEPTERRKIEGEGNAEILRYEHVVETSSHGTVFLLFAGGSDKRTRSTAYFEVHDGIITRYWTEHGVE